MDELWKFNEWVGELADPFWLKDAQKDGAFFDANGFARALLSASKPAVPSSNLPPPPKPCQKGWIYDAAQMRACALEAIAANNCRAPAPDEVAPTSQLSTETVDNPVERMNAAACDVLAERRRQVSAEGWTPDHDDKHGNGDLIFAAISYARASTSDWVQTVVPITWPWALEWWKPNAPRRNLVKAAALILAEIERIDRAAPASSAGD